MERLLVGSPGTGGPIILHGRRGRRQAAIGAEPRIAGGCRSFGFRTLSPRRQREGLRSAPALRGGSTVRDVHVGHPLPGNRFLRGLLVAYVGVFTVAAIAPHGRGDWLLENLLVFAFLGTLAATHRRFVFSNFSSLLIFLFLVLHAWGAHHTYSLTPLGFWLQDAFDLSRNHYDRIVHFAFGLLLTYPLHELARRTLHLRGGWSYAVPAVAVLALSSSYEILEWGAARIVDPELGTAFVGTQGDEWDAQKDMALALLGTAIALTLTALYRRCTGKEPWALLR